jgi:hypothetical protein
MAKNIILYAYLYERDDKWGFKVNNREIAFYSLSADKLDGKKVKIIKSKFDYQYETVLSSAHSGGKLYASFVKNNNFEKGELVRIDILE